MVVRDTDWIRGQRQALGGHLRQLREAEGFTQGGLAHALELGRYERTSIAHIEAGSQSAPTLFWQRADAILQANGSLVERFEELDQERDRRDREQRRRKREIKSREAERIDAGWETHLGDALVAMVSSWRTGAASEAMATPDDAALQWLLQTAPADHPARNSGARRIGVGEVAGVRIMRSHLKEIDNSLGGGVARPMTLAYLQQNVPVLLNSRYSEEIGRALMGAVAEITLDLGWMAYDSGRQPEARRHMLHALRLSHAAQDRLFGGRVLAAMCHQALHVGNVREALTLGRAARDGTSNIAPPVAVAMFAAMDACAQAASGESALCARSLATAEASLGEASQNDAIPEWLDFDQGGLAGHAARAWRDLQKPGDALPVARYAVAHCRPAHGRTRAQRKAILATTLVQVGELDEAVAVAESIVNDAWQLQSDHVRDEVVALARLLDRTRSRVADHFIDRARELALNWPSTSGPS